MIRSNFSAITLRAFIVLVMLSSAACSKKGAASSRLTRSGGSSGASTSAVQLTISTPSTQSWVNGLSDSVNYHINGTCIGTDQSKLNDQTVTIKEGTTVLGTGLCKFATFSVVIDTTALTEGDHTLVATATNSDGTSGTSDEVVIKRDVTQPTITVSSGPTQASVTSASTTSYELTIADTNLGTISNADLDYAITVTGSNKGCFVTTSGSSATTRTVTISGCNESGNANIAINNARLRDQAGNPFATATNTQSDFAISNSGPTLSISAPSVNGWVNSSATLATYSVQGTCNAAGETVSVSIDSGAVTGSGSCTGSLFSATVDISGLSAGQHVVEASITASGVTSTAKNRFAVDVIVPTLTISSPRLATVNSGITNSYTLTFADTNASSLNPSTILSAVTVNGNGASCTKSVNVTGATTAVVTLSSCSGSGSPTITVAATAWSDQATNAIASATSDPFVVDNALPTVAITSPTNNGYITPATDSATFAISGTCSENGRAVTLTINSTTTVNLGNCASGAFSGTINTTGLALGLIDLVASHSDAVGNTATSSTVSLTKVSSQATLVLTTAVNPTVKSSAILVTATFSADVSGFEASDITISGGTASGFAGTGKDYTFEVAPSSTTAQTNIVISVAASTSVDANNNPSAASNSLSIAFYPAPNSVTGTSPGTSNTPVVTVGNGVAGLVAKIYTDSGCTTENGSATMTGATEAITSLGITVSTTFYAKFSDGVNESSCSSSGFTYTFNSPRPSVTIASSNSSSPTTQAVIPMTATFTADVTGFTQSDITTTNGSVSNFAATSGSVYTFDFTPDSGTEGTFTIDIAENVAQDASSYQNFAALTFSRAYYRKTPTLTSGSSVTNDSTPDLTVGNIISGLTANLYSDASCSTSKGSASSSGTNALVTSSTISANTDFYADVTDADGNKSICSAVYSMTYDTTAPANATSLAWAGGSAASTTTLPITWTKSTDAGLANQKIQFHTGGGCGSASSLIDLNSAAAQSYTYTAPSAGSFSFQVISVDSAGNSATSSCSGTMTVTLTAVSLSPASFSFPAGQSLTVNFTASGGSGGNVFSIDSGSGSINASTGVYTGGTSRVPGTTTVVRVTDSASSSATVTITHTAMIVNGTVYTSVIDGTNMYVGGSFTLANYVNTKAFVGVDESSNQNLDYRISSRFNSGAVINAVLLSNGFAYVGGSFTSYNGTTVQNLAKINLSTAALDTTFTQTTGPNTTVYALAISGSSLYVGGYFTSYRGTAFTNIKVLKLSTTDGSRDTAYGNPFTLGGYNYDGTVYALLVANSSLYVGGNFSGANGGTSGNSLLKMDLTNGTATGLNGTTSPAGAVYALATDGTSLFVGGAMASWRSGTNTVNASYKYLLKLNWNTGALDTSFNLANYYPNGIVRSVAVVGSSLYVGGEFIDYRGDAKGAYLAKVNLTTGVLDTTNFNTLTTNPGPDNIVNAIAASSDGNSLFVGGVFNSYRGNGLGKRLIKINASTGALDTAAFHASSQALDGSVNAITVSGSTVYAGGSFAGRGVPAQNLVKFDLTNWSVDTSFTKPIGLNSAVRSIVVGGSGVYIGGDFTTYRGDSKGQYLAKLDPSTGNLDTASFNSAASGPNGSVNALLINNNDLYAGGSFTTYRASNLGNRMVRLNALTGVMSTTFNTSSTGPNATVHALSFNADKSKIFMGGAFTTYRSSSYCTRLCTLDSSTGDYASSSIFQTNGSPSDGTVYALALKDGNLYVGGSFTQYKSDPKGKYLAKINATTALMDATFNSSSSTNRANGQVNSISPSADGTYLYVGGSFTAYSASANGAYLVKVSSSNAAMETANFNTSASNVPGGIVYATALSSDGSKLYVGGSHTTYRGDATAGYMTSVSTTNGALSW